MSTMPRQKSGVKRRPLSKAEYYALADLGFFRGQKVELLGGNLVVQSPQNPAHFRAVFRVGEALRVAFGSGYWVRPQSPIDLEQTTEPEPDISVCVGGVDAYPAGHPTSAELIVEVSDTTLSFDRRHKAGLYARAGIADYWIVNLRRRVLEVRRQPMPDAGRPFGFRYGSLSVLPLTDTVSPLAMPTATISVASLFDPTPPAATGS